LNYHTNQPTDQNHLDSGNWPEQTQFNCMYSKHVGRGSNKDGSQLVFSVVILQFD